MLDNALLEIIRNICMVYYKIVKRIKKVKKIRKMLALIQVQPIPVKNK